MRERETINAFSKTYGYPNVLIVTNTFVELVIVDHNFRRQRLFVVHSLALLALAIGNFYLKFRGEQPANEVLHQDCRHCKENDPHDQLDHAVDHIVKAEGDVVEHLVN